MADLEGLSSNAFFEVLEEWNTVLLAERYLLEQALAVDDLAIAEAQPPSGSCYDQASVPTEDDRPADPHVAPKGAAKAWGIKR